MTQSGLSRVAAAGGQPAALTEIDPETRETTHRYPWFLPDGDHFIYFAGSHNLGMKDDVHGIYLSSLEEPKTPVQIVVEAYGELGTDGELLDLFIEANKLGDSLDGNGILVLDRGTEVITYA